MNNESKNNSNKKFDKSMINAKTIISFITGIIFFVIFYLLFNL